VVEGLIGYRLKGLLKVDFTTFEVNLLTPRILNVLKKKFSRITATRGYYYLSKYIALNINPN
jgi:hypothetical protein